MTTEPTLPEVINAQSTGHFAHHMALHTRYNATGDHTPRIAALESAVAGLGKPEYVVGPFSLLGTIDTLILSHVKLPAILNGDILRVEARLFTGPSAGNHCTLDVTHNGLSIFTAPTFPGPTFNAGQTAVQAVPDPAKKHLVEDDELSVHVVSLTGSVSDLTATIVVQPT